MIKAKLSTFRVGSTLGVGAQVTIGVLFVKARRIHTSVDDSSRSYSIVSTRRARLIIFVFYRIACICYIMIIPIDKVEFPLCHRKKTVYKLYMHLENSHENSHITL